MTTLANERGTSALSQYVRYEQIFNDLVQLARGSRRNGGPALQDPMVRQEMARHYVDLQGFKYNCFRVFSAIINGGTPGAEGSILKLLWSELNQRMQEAAMWLEGPASRVMAESGCAVENGRWQVSFLRSRANTIEAGTSEIQRNIVCERVLGLPRSLNAERASRAVCSPFEVLSGSHNRRSQAGSLCHAISRLPPQLR